MGVEWDPHDMWTPPAKVKVEHLGTPNADLKPGVVLASFPY